MLLSLGQSRLYLERCRIARTDRQRTTNKTRRDFCMSRIRLGDGETCHCLRIVRILLDGASKIPERVLKVADGKHRLTESKVDARVAVVAGTRDARDSCGLH